MRQQKLFVKEENTKAGHNPCVQDEISFQWNTAACLQSSLGADFEDLPDNMHWTEETSLKPYWSLFGWMGQGRFYVFSHVSLLRTVLSPNCGKHVPLMSKRVSTLLENGSLTCLWCLSCFLKLRLTYIVIGPLATNNTP